MQTTKVSLLTQGTHGRRVLLLCGFSILVMGMLIRGLAPIQKVAAIDPTTPELPQVCTELGPSSISAAAAGSLIWKNRAVLSVRFQDGPESLRAKVRHYAQVWSKYANIKFVFVESGPTDIRISFGLDGKSWSYVGTSATTISEKRATMHFGWLVEDKTPEDVIQRTVLHEFGHALGLVHENQSPNAPVLFKKSAVYAYYKKHYGWNKKVVDDNLFLKVPRWQARYTDYDPDSIMLYPIPADFTLDGKQVSWNTNLSKRDKELIRKLYPR